MSSRQFFPATDESLSRGTAPSSVEHFKAQISSVTTTGTESRLCRSRLERGESLFSSLLRRDSPSDCRQRSRCAWERFSSLGPGAEESPPLLNDLHVLNAAALLGLMTPPLP